MLFNLCINVCMHVLLINILKPYRASFVSFHGNIFQYSRITASWYHALLIYINERCSSAIRECF